ncbi:hypothetical protein SAMD00019534_093620 [Acytostelium subglobosum LB1]|uniref:hypothetical protein n=1 Tax=Acytostelium subglobosum LB1 TaxID=1410327 RepID=UPI000644FEC4|nr:hypothetical protein SAMD00019534_093620 [Acytostelium subglobosum LB1]GAM26187.1 hypothetical protein SAMD00019534_093620 [Acytostelium subglobosum LB1]|eukprot:XP_012750741.1 hypothetical protein SAMD00019534_093620 [Acytostelium subglobosum LB1]
MPAVQTLNEQERGKVSFVNGSSCDLIALTVAKLYQGFNGKWDYTGIQGAISIVYHRLEKAHYIRIVDLQTTKTIFEQEIYERFEYQRQRDFFHTFEGDSAVFGLSFVSVEEALDFQTKILNIIPKVKIQQQQQQQQHQASQSKKSKSGFLSKILHKNDISSTNDKPLDISAPTGFRHEGHIGRGENGPEIRNIPETFVTNKPSARVPPPPPKIPQTILQSSSSPVIQSQPPLPSIKPPLPKVLQEETMGLQSLPRPLMPSPTVVETLAAPSDIPPPPPRPPIANCGAPKPKMQLPSINDGVAVSAQAEAPVGQSMPPPPAEDSRDAVLESLRKPVTLRPVDTTKPLPNPKVLVEPATKTMAEILIDAMEDRLKHMGEMPPHHEEEDEDDDDDEWIY